MTTVPDSNVYVLEVRDGIVLYLNEQTRARDGWHWGTAQSYSQMAS